MMKFIYQRLKEVGIEYLSIKILQLIILKIRNKIEKIFQEDFNKRSYYSLEDLSQYYSIPCYKILNLNNSKYLKLIYNLEIDLIITIGFNQIIKKNLIEMPKYGCINVHPSLLPKFRGKSPVFWAFALGEVETGVTIHYIFEGMDTGDIILQKKIEITSSDTLHTLNYKILKLESDLLLKAITNIEKERVNP